MLYLAMTASEFAENPSFPAPIAGMACHFSSYCRGLSNLPLSLPADSCLILNDRIPIMGHDPALVASQLADTAQSLRCSRILLDFQRPAQPIAEVIGAILQLAPCPVGVSELYAAGLECPIMLPPLPPNRTPEEYIACRRAREAWLELALASLEITVTEAGSRLSPAPPPKKPLPFMDEALHCHYGLSLAEGAAVFTLHRTAEDLNKLLDAFPCCVGLYQELKQFGGTSGLTPPGQ